ncbi:hypothetical protein VPNG_08248 [Cytospora leucostoma]|uniref:NAD(P)-binding protein n=1 Tax=Cytospora leucostoma TaxID=1230097 RepID=A0A423W768_9PEZI|nr:hypothetical protein VPNG_08248 [Cytospora leucostoma]
MGSIEPSEWWIDFEVNVKGAYLMIHHFLNQRKTDAAISTRGTVISLNTGAAGMSMPNMSSYTSSKLAQTRIMETLHAEQPEVRSFTLLPGLLNTPMTAEAFKPFARDDPMLAGGMTLFLSTPRADWLRGGVISVNSTCDIEEMEAHKQEIRREGRIRLAYINAQLQKGGHPWSEA